MRTPTWPTVLVMLASTFFCAYAQSTNSISIRNEGTRSGSHVLYVEIVSGKCNSPSQLRQTVPINPDSTMTLPILGESRNACWIASTFPTVSEFPLFCGDTEAGSTIVLSKTTKICDLPMGQAEGLRTRFDGVQTRTLTAPAHLEYYLTAWNDPLTPPHTTTTCIGYASGHWPWCDNWKTCNQWATQCQFMRNEAYLVIDATSPDNLKAIVDQCLQKSACAAALAGVVAVIATGGGALAAAEQAFTEVMLACLADQAIGVSIRFDIRPHWTPYGSCT
jgi:hypothetical protein